MKYSIRFNNFVFPGNTNSVVLHLLFYCNSLIPHGSTLEMFHSSRGGNSALKWLKNGDGHQHVMQKDIQKLIEIILCMDYQKN